MLPEPQLNAAFMPQSVSVAQGTPTDGQALPKMVISENRPTTT